MANNQMSLLTMNASLASALALHGVAKNKSNNEFPTPAGWNTRKKTSIHALTVHPSLSRVAYLEEEETVISILPNYTNVPTNKRNRGSSPKSAKAEPSSTKSQRLVIQQYNNHIHEILNGRRSQNSVLASVPMEKLPPQINKFRQPKSKSSKITNQPLTLASLGPLQSITFLDRDALFWQTRRQYGRLTNLDISTSALMNSGSEEMNEEEAVLYSDSDMNNVDGIMGKGLCLGLQFERVLVVLQFNNNHSADDQITVLCCLEGQRTNASSGKEIKVQYTPTSSAVPITNSIVVYGCSDGAMRFHNLVPSMLYSSKDNASGTAVFSLPSSSSSSIGGVGGKPYNKQTRQATIKSVRGPNGRNDPVVKIVNVDPAYNEVKQSKENLSSIPTPDENGTGTYSDYTTLVIRSRLLTVCASGVAYLWDVHVLIDRASGALRDMNVLPVS